VVCPLETPSTALRIGPRGERTLRPPQPCVDDDDESWRFNCITFAPVTSPRIFTQHSNVTVCAQICPVCNKGITQFYLPPTHEPYFTLLPSHKASPTFGWYSLCLPTKEWPGWVDMGGWSHTEINVWHRELNPDMVTHPSTNQARRRVTLLIRAMPLTHSNVTGHQPHNGRTGCSVLRTVKIIHSHNQQLDNFAFKLFIHLGRKKTENDMPQYKKILFD